MFANVDAAEKWFEENDPEGVAFEYWSEPHRPQGAYAMLVIRVLAIGWQVLRG
ncbi:hypothetical protein GWE18_07705 [Bradyrhizobium sp. CSA112]|uniref:hypothetical protein n=1 Tax=Bradyrhizobium sp. CSA112 TaxID=2699170 RepID=UPI0023B0B72A|nr:hypothetical protein [Bradyrhizobium sp. CSA112]MDE5452754.1 hypothetical protein [Bradyrhizobium sp. CSA112]